MDYEFIQDIENTGEVFTMSSDVPEFDDKWEENEYFHGVIAQALNNLADRIAAIEEFVKKFPEPGVNMIKYKPDGYDDHLNIKQLFDDLYTRLNNIEGR